VSEQDSDVEVNTTSERQPQDDAGEIGDGTPE
jgi:hypothetical protein